MHYPQILDLDRNICLKKVDEIEPKTLEKPITFFASEGNHLNLIWLMETLAALVV